MRITFIRPHLTDRRSSAAMQPLVFAILAGLTPPDVELDFFDERLEPIPEDHDTDLVGLSVDTYTARRAYQIATQFRRRDIPVVMGGYHPSFLPEETLAYADAVVIGDAEGIWGQLVQDVQRGRLQRIYRDSKQPSLEGLKFDRSIFKGKGYKLVAPVQFGRGCRYACDFCSIHAFYGSHTRQRPVAEVVAEIEALDRRYIVFIDDNLFVDILKVEELLRALIPLNIHWACQISIDIAENAQLMDLMAKSGCFCAMIGFESLHEDNLRQMKKKWNLKHGDYDITIRKFRDRGIMVYASLVFGYDYDTVDTFDVTAEFAIRSKCALANVNTLAPMPGSRLYNRLMKENRLIYERWWIDPNYRYGQATFHPLQMTADELAEGCMRARRIFHGYGAILKRALDPLANSRNIYRLGLFLAVNLLARRELAYKLEHRLGADAPLEPPLENVPIQLTSSKGLRLGTATGR
jgi:radical SAM superfamily enzyme YgiQ (UPF0313 family)